MSGLHDSGTPADRDLAHKTFSRVAASAAFRGFALWRSDAADGVVRFFVGKSDLVRVCADLNEVEGLLEQVAARSAQRGL